MDRHYGLTDFGVACTERTLANGLKAVFVQKPFAPIYAKIMMRAGSVFDPIERPGLAHFTEHLIASGSRTHSKEQFSALMESIGGYWNAATTDEYMSVQCEVATVEHMSNMGEYFSHALSEIHVTEQSLEQEKSIIISEIERANSDPEYHAYLYTGSVFGNGTRWGRPTLGTIESVKAITIEDVEQFFSSYCTVENMVLVISGGCTIEDIEKAFASIAFARGSLHELPGDPAVVSPASTLSFVQDIPQTNIMLAFVGPDLDTRDDHLLSFVLRYAHDGITSRFFKKIRNQKALAYDISFRTLGYSRLQYMATVLGVPTEKTTEAIAAVKECYAELLEEGIRQQEIDHKIDTMWFSTKRSMQRSSDWVSTLAYDTLYPSTQPLHGRFPDVYNYRRTYTSDEINAALRRYIVPAEMIVLVNGRQ